MTLTMADSISAANLPPGYSAYAAYSDGRWPDYAAMVARFPRAYHYAVTVLGGAADECDCENGDLTPAQAVTWARQKLAAGAWRPGIYASVSVMAASVLPALYAAGISRASVRLRSAHYGAGEHICGPATCKLVSVPMDGTQWTDTAPGENGTQVDASLLADGFFGAPAPSPRNQEDHMPQLCTGHGQRDAFSFAGQAYKEIGFASDPGGDGVAQTAIRVALHKSGNDWLVETVTLTPAEPVQVLGFGGAAYDAAEFSRLDDGGAVGVSFA